MKTKPTRNVSCPQCGTEVEGSYYTYMMECNRCLAKKDE
ncbi:YhfH family protein [Halobacillus seohaensis]|uniref:YhfH family protein n=1 Tax=Halobacillus seohaensis TaxID=447421 RepID=A0ABW2EUC2_9BACI